MNLMEKEKNEMEKVTVARGSTHLLPFQVEKPGSILKLEKTVCYTYNFDTDKIDCLY